MLIITINNSSKLFLERLASDRSMSMRPSSRLASRSFSFSNGRPRITSTKKTQAKHLTFGETRITMLVSFPKELLPAFWLQVKVSTKVVPIRDQPVVLVPSYEFGTQSKACPSLTGYQWSGSFGSHS